MDPAYWGHLFDLTGKAALVTGGSRGLGKAMARGLALAGANVIITGRSDDDLKIAMSDVLAGTAGQGAYFVADLRQREETESLARFAADRFGGVDILVSNAGSSDPEAIDQVSDKGWDNLLEQNLSSAMVLTRAVVPYMKRQRWGRIVYIGSVTGAFTAMEDRAAYASTKAGLTGLTRVASLELGKFGITVNCIAPGPFLTGLQARMLTPEQLSNLDKIGERTTIGRLGDPDEMAGPVVFLASAAGSFVTGATLVVDGGLLARGF